MQGVLQTGKTKNQQIKLAEIVVGSELISELLVSISCSCLTHGLDSPRARWTVQWPRLDEEWFHSGERLFAGFSHPIHHYSKHPNIPG